MHLYHLNTFYYLYFISESGPQTSKQRMLHSGVKSLGHLFSTFLIFYQFSFMRSRS